MVILFMNSWLQKFQSKPTISSVANGYQMNTTGTNRWTNVQERPQELRTKHQKLTAVQWSQHMGIFWQSFDIVLEFVVPAIQNYKMYICHVVRLATHTWMLQLAAMAGWVRAPHVGTFLRQES